MQIVLLVANMALCGVVVYINISIRRLNAEVSRMLAENNERIAWLRAHAAPPVPCEQGMTSPPDGRCYGTVIIPVDPNSKSY